MPVAQPTISTVVRYQLADDDVAIIRERRKLETCRRGTPVKVGETVSLVVTALCIDGVSVNGQALLDGDDSLWVCGAVPGDGPGKFLYSLPRSKA